MTAVFLQGCQSGADDFDLLAHRHAKDFGVVALGTYGNNGGIDHFHRRGLFFRDLVLRVAAVVRHAGRPVLGSQQFFGQRNSAPGQNLL